MLKDVKTTVTDMLAEDKMLVNSSSVATRLKQVHGHEVKKRTLTGIMSKEMKLTYRATTPIEAYVNSRKNIVMRAHFALALSRVLAEGYTIINFDECSFSSTTSHKMSYR